MLKGLNSISFEEISMLFSPITIEEFSTVYWAFQHCHLKNSIDRLLLKELDPCEELSTFFDNPAVLNQLECQVRSINGKRTATSQNDILMGLQSGETLQLRKLQLILSARHPLIRLTAELALFLGHPLDSVSIFISPGNTQALPKHMDDTEIFTIQLSGTKTWLLYYPAGVKTVNMSEGDLLYVPSGLWHEVRAAAESSVSVAIIFRRISLDVVISELIRKALGKSPKGRATLPIFNSRLSNVLNNEDLAELIYKLIKNIKDVSIADILNEAKLLSMLYSSKNKLNLTGNWWAGEFPLRLLRDRHVSFLIKSDDQLTQIQLATGATLTFPSWVKVELKRILADGNATFVDDYSANLDKQEMNLVLKALCRVGIFKPHVYDASPSLNDDSEFVKRTTGNIIARAAHDKAFRLQVLKNATDTFRQLGVMEDKLPLFKSVLFVSENTLKVDFDYITLPEPFRLQLQHSDILYTEPEGYER